MNELADALSRAPNICSVRAVSGEDAVIKEQSEKGIINGVDADKWAEEQQKDSFCQAALALCSKERKSAAEQARADNYVTDRNVLFREVNRGNGTRTFGVVVPATMQYELIKAAHASTFAGHKGVRITLQRLRGFLLAWHECRRRGFYLSLSGVQRKQRPARTKCNKRAAETISRAIGA